VKKNLLFVVIFAVVLVVSAYFVYPAFGGCNVSIVSKSKLISVKVVDKKLFKAFVYSLVPCERGYFMVGDPFEQKGPYVVKDIQIVFDDIKHDSEVFSKTKNGELSQNPLYTHDIKFKGREALIYMSFNKDFVNDKGFNDLFTFFVLTQLDSMYKFNRVSERIGKNYNSNKGKYSIEGIGLKANIH